MIALLFGLVVRAVCLHSVWQYEPTCWRFWQRTVDDKLFIYFSQSEIWSEWPSNRKTYQTKLVIIHLYNLQWKWHSLAVLRKITGAKNDPICCCLPDSHHGGLSGCARAFLWVRDTGESLRKGTCWHRPAQERWVEWILYCIGRICLSDYLCAGENLSRWVQSFSSIPHPTPLYKHHQCPPPPHHLKVPTP